MKPLQLFTILLTVLALQACHRQRHTIIATTTPGMQLKIEYAGQVHFNDEGTDIENISPGGYVKYTLNGESLEAEGDRHGVITYRLNGGKKQITLNTDDKQFVARAVKEMIKQGHNNDNR